MSKLYYILSKAISKLFGFDYNQKLYYYYQFTIIDSNIFIYLKFCDNVESHILEFVALEILGNNYLSWILNAEMHLDAMNLRVMTKEENQASLQDDANTLIFLRHHPYEGFKNEYLTVKDPFTLWSYLKERFDH